MADYYLRSMRDLYSPQAQAVSGQAGMGYNGDAYESYIEGMGASLPELREAEYNRRMLKEERRMIGQQNRLARRDAMASMAVQGVDLGARAIPIAKKAKSYLSSLRGTPSYAQDFVGSGITAGTTSEAASIASGVSGLAPATAKVATAIPFPGAERAATAVAPKAAAGIGTYLSPAGWGMAAGQIGGEHTNRAIGRALGFKHKTDTQKAVGGISKGLIAGFIASGGNPLGAVIGGIGGALGSLF